MGIGGGVLLIPGLIFFCGITQHGAQAINLLYFIPTALIALIVHIKNHRIEKKILLPLILGGLAGAAAGSYAATLIEGDVLQKIFGWFLLVMGGLEIKKGWKKEGAKTTDI